MMMFETSKHVPKTEKRCCVFNDNNNVTLSLTCKVYNVKTVQCYNLKTVQCYIKSYLQGLTRVKLIARSSLINS